MKKIAALLLALAMVLCMVACGEQAPAAPATPEEVKGETHDTGAFTALIPEGWLAIPVKDVWAEDSDTIDPDALQIVKGGQSEWDLFSKPYIQINHYGPDTEMVEPWKDLYDGVEDLADFTAGSLTWKGFACKDLLGGDMIVLWTANDAADHQYSLTVVPKTDDGEITLQDADVLALLGSLTGK